jgi:hypothetical protein
VVISTWVALLAVGVLPAAPVQAPAQSGAAPKVTWDAPEAEVVDVTGILASLRAKRGSPFAYYDLHHGTPNGYLRELMEVRFEATRAILVELEWLESAPQVAGFEAGPGAGSAQWSYRQALYHVLAMVKDPRTIEWLETRVDEGRGGPIYDEWLHRWKYFPIGQNYAERSWLAEEDRWSALLRRLADKADSPTRRLLALQVMQQWFTDEETVRYFLDLRQDSTLTPEQSLAVEFFLDRNGIEADAARIQTSIDAMRTTEEGFRELTYIANYMRHESFVPWLIGQGLFGSYTLRRSTLNFNARWDAWWQEHGAEGRERWVDTFFASLFELYDRDPAAAAEWLDKSQYSMDGDLIVAEHLLEVADRPLLDDRTCVLLMFVYRPHLRPRLQAVADKIMSRHPSGDGLKDGLRCLGEVGLVPRTVTWEEVVAERVRY